MKQARSGRKGREACSRHKNCTIQRASELLNILPTEVCIAEGAEGNKFLKAQEENKIWCLVHIKHWNDKCFFHSSVVAVCSVWLHSECSSLERKQKLRGGKNSSQSGNVICTASKAGWDMRGERKCIESETYENFICQFFLLPTRCRKAEYKININMCSKHEVYPRTWAASKHEKEIKVAFAGPLLSLALDCFFNSNPSMQLRSCKFMNFYFVFRPRLHHRQGRDFEKRKKSF